MADSDDAPVARTEVQRRPYEPPAVSWEQPFEIEANLASACGKIGGTGEPCDSAPSS